MQPTFLMRNQDIFKLLQIIQNDFLKGATTLVPKKRRGVVLSQIFFVSHESLYLVVFLYGNDSIFNTIMYGETLDIEYLFILIICMTRFFFLNQIVEKSIPPLFFLSQMVVP